jgi:hypothetical protein
LLPNRRAVVTLALACLPGLLAPDARGFAQKPPVNPDAQLLQDFQHRIDAYMDLHEKLEKGAPPLKPTDSPGAIKASQDTLAARIRQARSGAKQGEIFTPEIAKHFRKLMQPELKGPAAPETKKAIKDDAPAAIPLKVNARYPDEAPLPTVPPNLLIRLPKVPEDLEYRIVGENLILRDVHANVIVDFMPRAVR